MRFIQNLSIRNKLLIISLIPLAALLVFLVESALENLETRDSLKRLNENVLEIDRISEVLHQISQERAYSLTYVVVPDATNRKELFGQRDITDDAISQLRETLRRQNKQREYVFIDRLSDLRSTVTLRGANVDSLGAAFINLHTQITDEISAILSRSGDLEISRHLEAHLSMAHAKRFLGEVRARVTLAILTNGFQNNEFALAAAARGRYEISIEQFANKASPELTRELRKAMSEPTYRLAVTLMDSVFSKAQSQITVDNETWRNNFSAPLNALANIEALSSSIIKELAESRLSETTSELVRDLVVAVLLVAGIALLLYSTITDIVSSVMRLKEAADRISRGDVDLSVDVSSKDEIGLLAGSFNQLVAITRDYSEAAELIGQGDYSAEVTVRSDKDTLGIALNNMKNNLKRLAGENEKRTWLLSGSSELNDKMRGERSVKELAQEVVTKLASYLNAQIGAIYLAENGHLALVGSYAFQQRKDNTNIIYPGQGLVGQSALEKKPIVFRPVPDDYIQINSGLGRAVPKNLIVYPFLYEDEVKGVIELGSASDFTEEHMQFLNLVAENVGIAFNSSQSRTQMKELLEETQRQAEEMEAQQEELRQINEELQEKTQLLEKSENELKAQQEELQQTNEELEEKANLLEEQKEKLEVAKMDVETKARELEVTSKYKSEFLANMSHELRTPLNSMLILSQILSENKSRALGEKEVEFARNIYNSGTDLLNLINEILDLSKVEAGKIELDITEVPLPEVVESLSAMFREVARNKSIDFTIDFKEEDFDAPFTTDAQRLEQILRNLLSNAFKFTGEGGQVSLGIKRVGPRNSAPKAAGKAGRDQVEFTVSDTGIGIPESKLNVVFEAFQQADGSTKRKFGGTGLGLSISRELAHALGGEIHLESEEGKGTTFTLYLPVTFDPTQIAEGEKKIFIKPRRNGQPSVPANGRAAGKAAQASDHHDDRFTVSEKDRLVLIIEDDDAFAGVLLDFVRGKGYKGIVANQGNTGLSLARHYQPDAIILDMKLPVMEGSEVLKQLKNDPDLRHIPVQIISGYDHRKESFELGAFDFVKKPISKGELDSAFGRIEEFVNRKLKRLLVVEDDKVQNNSIKELIGNGDVKSVSAYTGAEAYEMMQNEKFDCVILDLGLPDMTGFDLMEKIKANPQLNKTPLIVYTGKDLSKAEAAQLNKLANTVVLKTVNSNERLLDETILFLHKVESKLPAEKQQIIRSLHRTEEVLKSKKILIVDDDMRNIYSLTNALEEEGVRCITAENGKAALTTLSEHPDTDIILMDVMMPEMDGLEATREIRKKDRYAKLPIIALTAKAMKGDREKCLEAGMSDYISKPVNIEQLLSLMRVWLYK